MLPLLPALHPVQTYNWGRSEYKKGNAYAQVAISTKVWLGGRQWLLFRRTWS